MKPQTHCEFYRVFTVCTLVQSPSYFCSIVKILIFYVLVTIKTAIYSLMYVSTVKSTLSKTSVKVILLERNNLQ